MTDDTRERARQVAHGLAAFATTKTRSEHELDITDALIAFANAENEAVAHALEVERARSRDVLLPPRREIASAIYHGTRAPHYKMRRDRVRQAAEAVLFVLNERADRILAAAPHVDAIAALRKERK